MNKINAQPRPAGTTVLFLLAIALAVLALPASSLAAPMPEGSDPVLTISPQPAVVPTTTVGNQSPTAEFQLHNDSGEEPRSKRFRSKAKTLETSPSAAPTAAVSSRASSARSRSLSNRTASAPRKRLSTWISAGGQPDQGFEISGLSVEPKLTFSPSSYDFGLQRVYENRNTYLQLTNSGEATVQVNNIEIQGGSGSFWTGNGDCLSRPARTRPKLQRRSQLRPPGRCRLHGRTAGDLERLRLHGGARRHRRARSSNPTRTPPSSAP